jgi:predicted anti-sigma-YlaC factor YlaD
MPTHTHPIEPEELMAYLDGELAPERAQVAAAHLEECPDCQAIVSDFQSVTMRLREWEIEAPQFPFPAKAGWRRAWLQPLASWAAALAAGVIFIGLVAWPRFNQATNYSRRMPTLYEPRAAVEPKIISAAPPPLTVSPLIAHSASLVMVVTNLDHARAAIDRILQNHHGYLAHMNVTVPTDSARTLEASLRTPDPELDSTIRELRSLGNVGSESRTGEEVTQQSIDLDARLTNARNTEQRLTGLLRERTGKLSDVLAVEDQIDATREQIERMEAERKNLNDRIAFATIDLHVSEVYKPAIDGTRAPVLTSFRNAGIQGLERAADSFVAAFTWVLSAGPLLLAWCAVLFLPARWAWRRLKR